MYQIVASSLKPYPWLLLLTFAGLAWVWRKQPEARRRLRWVFVPLLGLLVVSTPAVAYVALGSLEWSYPPRNGRPTNTKAIVVLGGYLRPPDEVQPEAELGQDTLLPLPAGREALPRWAALPGGGERWQGRRE